MRILHTSDLHVGRMFDNRSLEDVQRKFVTWFCDQAQSREVDLIVIAGDIWDRAHPSVEAVQQLDDALNALAALRIPVIVIAGNHDKAQRLGFGAKRQALGGIHIFAEDERHPDPWPFHDASGEVSLAVVAVPYLDPRRFADSVTSIDGTELSTDGPRTHADVLRSALEVGRTRARARFGSDVPLLAVCHATVLNSEQREGEEGFEIGGIAMVDATVFEPFSYAALGHLHTSQEVRGHPRVAYSGSPIPYSYHEEEAKSVRLVELDASGAFTSAEIPIPMGRPVKRFTRLTIDELLDPARVEEFRDFWVSVELPRSAGIQDAAMARLRKSYPYITHLQYDQAHDPGGRGGSHQASSRDRALTPELRIAAFLEDYRGRGPSDAETDLITKSLEKAREDLRQDREQRGADVTSP